MVASNNNRSNSKGEHDMFAVAMAPPAIKAKTHHHVIPHKVQRNIKSNKDDYGVYDNDNEALFTKVAKLLDNGDPMAVE
jgi:hypothetical protein